MFFQYSIIHSLNKRPIFSVKMFDINATMEKMQKNVIQDIQNYTEIKNINHTKMYNNRSILMKFM